MKWVVKRHRRVDESGQALAMVLVAAFLLIGAASYGVIGLASTVTSAKISNNQEVVRATANSAAAVFVAALDNTGTFPPATAGTRATDVYPHGLSVTSAGWYKLGPTGLASCTEAHSVSATPCVRITDRVQKLPYTAPGATASTAVASPYDINLQVTVRSNCQSPGSPPAGCQLSRLEERIAPRLFTNYVEFDNSELLDPLLVSEGYPTVPYTHWYAHCTNNGVVKKDTTSGIVKTTATGWSAGTFSNTCLAPAYLGAGAYSGTPGATAGDVVNGPIATNDSTIFVCGHGTTQPSFKEEPEATGSTPTHQYPVPIAGTGATCTGAPPTGKQVGKAQFPRSDFAYSTIAAAGDQYSGKTYIALCGTANSNTYHVGTTPATNCSSGVQNAWPATGVIYVNGTAFVSGTTCESGVTIAATGDVGIVNDLINGRLAGNAACKGSIGLVADNAVTVTPGDIGQTCPTTGVGECTGKPSRAQVQCWKNSLSLSGCQIVEAAVMALGDNSGTTKVPAPGSTSGSCSYLTTVSADHPTYWWQLSTSKTGTTPTSVSTPGDVGTLHGSVATATLGPIACDHTKAGMAFKGSGTYVSTGGVAQTATTTTSSSATYTVMAWFKATAQSGTILSLGSSATGTSTKVDRKLYLTHGKLEFCSNNNCISSTATYTNDSWTMAVATVGSAGEYLYVDGAKVATSGNTRAETNFAGYWRIGELATTASNFTGTIGEVAVWSSKALNTAQQKAIYSSATSVSTAGLGGSFYEKGWNQLTSPATPQDTCTFSQALAADAPTSWWQLNTPGPSETDSGSAHNTGTLVNAGAVGVTPGPIPCDTSMPAVSLSQADGSKITTSQKVQTKTTAAVSPATYTEMAWFKTKADGGLVALSSTPTGQVQGSSQPYDRMLYVGEDGKINFCSDGACTVSPSAYNNGQWTMVLATVGSTGAHLYVNGQLVAANSAETNAQTNFTGYWRLGRLPGLSTDHYYADIQNDGQALTGTLGDVAVWQGSALTTAQQTALYNAATTPTVTTQCGTGSSCVMDFRGSITENFRGAFGTYKEQPHGGPVLTTGIAKNIQFDTTLATQQPPYFLLPVAGIWQQEGVTFTGALQP